MSQERKRKQQPQTVAECWAWFWATPGATWDQVFALLDRVDPLTCLRDSSGEFVRDANGVIVVVSADTGMQQAA